MSRGGRGGGRGGFGGGRPGLGDGLNLAGMSYADISASGSANQEALYPDYPHPFPILPGPSLTEHMSLATQVRFGWDMSLRSSFLKETQKGDDIERYSDRYLATTSNSTQLNIDDYPGGRDFFPSDLYDGYFHPGKKLRTGKPNLNPNAKRKKLSKLLENATDGDMSNTANGTGGGGGGIDENGEGGGGAGSDIEDEDYDVDDGEDDYADQYFDNGEDDDADDGLGGGGDEDGGTFD